MIQIESPNQMRHRDLRVAHGIVAIIGRDSWRDALAVAGKGGGFATTSYYCGTGGGGLHEPRQAYRLHSHRP
jgi:hypothetical protein